MEKFHFYQDTKVITWERDHFTVKQKAMKKQFQLYVLGLAET